VKDYSLNRISSSGYNMRRILLLLMIVAISCDNTTTLSADNYDTSCLEDSDCVVIFVGEMCECSCNYGAINKSDKEKYDEDYDSIQCDDSCDDVDINCMFCNDQTIAVCTDNQCRADIVPP
jgi:hypothetical protein